MNPAHIKSVATGIAKIDKLPLRRRQLIEAPFQRFSAMIDFREALVSQISELVEDFLVKDQSIATVFSKMVECLEPGNLAGPSPEIASRSLSMRGVPSNRRGY